MNNVIREEQAWVLDVGSLDDRIERLRCGVRRLEDREARVDLGRMVVNIDAVRDRISQESVRCRNLNRTTGNLQRLLRDLELALDTTEGLLTMAVLMA